MTVLPRASMFHFPNGPESLPASRNHVRDRESFASTVESLFVARESLPAFRESFHRLEIVFRGPGILSRRSTISRAASSWDPGATEFRPPLRTFNAPSYIEFSIIGGRNGQNVHRRRICHLCFWSNLRRH